MHNEPMGAGSKGLLGAAAAAAALAGGVSGIASGTTARGASSRIRSPGAFSTRFPRRTPTRPTGVSLKPSRTKPYWACPEGVCTAIVDPVSKVGARRFALPLGGAVLEGGGELGGYDPQDLRSAYKIPTSGGTGQTVAIVDAYGDTHAESDLAKYRERYGLEPCTHAGGCFSKVNQAGEERGYPPGNKGWEGETSLDLDMVSAACPQCHILLVQATSASVANLAEAVDTAARLGATEITNSYGVAEEACGEGHCEEFNSAYDHPGVLVVASAGDSGYDNVYEKAASPSFPASSPHVLAVGGTSLRKASGTRGWVEEVWNEPKRELGTGSGCSLSELKPVWQTDSGCSKRTDNDLAAVAACETPLSVYSSAYGGWEDFCGTSASSPLVTGILAHASAYARDLGARALYEDRAALFEVTKGANGSCTVEYLCNAEKSQSGYNGPAGLGTPDGVPVLSPTVTGVLPAVGSALGGVPVQITGTRFAGTTAVKFGSAALTKECSATIATECFKVKSETEIEAVSPPGAGTVNVTVTTPAGTSAISQADEFSYEIAPLLEGRPFKTPIEEGKEPAFAIPSEGSTFALGPMVVDGAAGETAKVQIDTREPSFEPVTLLYNGPPGEPGFRATGAGITAAVEGFNSVGGHLIGPVSVACSSPADVVLAEIPIVSSAGTGTSHYSASFSAECMLGPEIFDDPGTAKVTMSAVGPEKLTPGQEVTLSEASFTVTLPKEWAQWLYLLGGREARGRCASSATGVIVG
jgi:hypothetical protein